MNNLNLIKGNAASLQLRRRSAGFIGSTALLGLVLSGCSSSNAPTTRAPKAPIETSEVPETAVVDVVLPVPSNPIVNTATAKTLKIESVLVENNVDAAKKGVSDHLEIALRNTATTDATSVEVFYSVIDPTAGATENYYTKLPADFVVPGAGTRIVHFDDTGAPDHFPVSKFSLYYTSRNALDVAVTVSAKDAAMQTFTVSKDAGGAEAAD